jgi:hypothetical protein
MDDYTKGLSTPLSYGQRKALEEMRAIDKVGEADRRRATAIENSGVSKAVRTVENVRRK